jgi:hypothetical protein
MEKKEFAYFKRRLASRRVFLCKLENRAAIEW